MKYLPPAIRLLAVVLLCLPLRLALSAGADATAVAMPATVSADTLNRRLGEIEASSTLGDEMRVSLVDMVNKALANLETARSNRAATESYIRLREEAPGQEKKIQAQLQKEKKSPGKIRVSATLDTPFKEVERELLQEKANLAAIEAKRDDMESQLEASRERPAAIQKQLAAAKGSMDDLQSEQNIATPAKEHPWLTEARSWARDTRVAALRSEIGMLDQELLTMPFRVELLEAQRAQLASSVERTRVRIKMLEELANRLGHDEARAAEAAADAAVSEAEGKHPLIQDLATKNAKLTDEITALTVAMKKSSASYDSIDKETKRIDEAFRRAREQLAVAGINDVLGEVLRRQRQSLPDPRVLRRKLDQLEDRHASLTLQTLQQEAEVKRLGNQEEFIAELTHDMDESEVEQIRDDLLKLAQSRSELLEKDIKLKKAYRRSLTELAASYRELLDSGKAYDKFLAQNLLWIRSAPLPSLESLGTLPEQFALLFAPSRWFELPAAMYAGVLKSWQVKVLLLLWGLLVWKTRYLRRKLLALGEPVGRPDVDTITCTLKAFGVTLLLALTWPLLILILGMALAAGVEVAAFAEQVAASLRRVATTFFYLQFFSILCLPGGLAEQHFRWPQGLPKALYREFYRLKVTLLPVMFVLMLVIYDHDAISLSSIERLSMVTALLLVAVFFYRMFGLLVNRPDIPMLRQRYFWLALTVAAPLVLALLGFVGFFYTAGTLGAGLLQSLWIAFGLVVLHQLVVRWLLLTRRRLALQALRERMQAAREEKASGDAEVEGLTVQVEEPEVDIDALSEESRKLLSLLLVTVGFFGFWFVWSDIMPAFNILHEVSLWHKTAIVAGEQAIVPVTLADLGIALLIAFFTYVGMKRLPPLLEILLLQRVSMTSGARYTARTLITYAIVGVGLIAFFNFVGVDWSKVQWLFAALSVGIGFGLQEIVANFISGLIILFERPIRVGDVVTVGDTEGVVSRIQIRATTIRTWDGQELLVPNKEFITGRLLNWSLSDQITRIKIPVGVAYGSDVQKAMALMDEAARQNETILADPAPYIMFNGFGDNTLNLELRCFVGRQAHRLPSVTNLHEEINRRFNEAGISIAFPQRDVHLDVTTPIDVRIQRDVGRVPPPDK